MDQFIVVFPSCSKHRILQQITVTSRSVLQLTRAIDEVSLMKCPKFDNMYGGRRVAGARGSSTRKRVGGGAEHKPRAGRNQHKNLTTANDLLLPTAFSTST
jgi:hypothetical protein